MVLTSKKLLPPYSKWRSVNVVVVVVGDVVGDGDVCEKSLT